VSANAEIGLAVVGLGYWGPNLLRAAWDLEDVRIRAVCDRDGRALAKHARRYPDVRATRDVEEVLAAADVDAVLLATPVSTHYDLSLRLLDAGKHVLVEKPLAHSVEACDDLIARAEASELVLMPGHTFLYSPPVTAIKRMLEANELGRIYFGTSSRANLGIHQSDVSVIRDLGPHDFSILLHWLGQPTFVRAIARDSVVPGMLDVAFVDVGYEDGCIVKVELSWLAPTKLRRTVLVGSEKMILYDDTSVEQVRVFDRGIDLLESAEPQSFGEHQLAYRSGDVLTPRIDPDEPLRLELEDFLHSIRAGCEPRSHARLGRDIVQMIDATERSIELNGAAVSLVTGPDDRRRTPDRRRGSGAAQGQAGQGGNGAAKGQAVRGDNGAAKGRAPRRA